MRVELNIRDSINVILGKKINFNVSRAPPASPFTPTSKIFISFPVFTFRNHLYIMNCLIGCQFTPILFVDWLLHILKLKISRNNFNIFLIAFY